MNQDQQYIDQAFEELVNPTLGTTEQLVSVLKLEFVDAKPVVARVASDQNTTSVYFKVEGARFFLVVNLSNGDHIEPTGCWIESGHRVYLTATSETLSFQQLSEYLNLKPLGGWSKGDLRSDNKSHHGFSRITFEPNKNEAFGLEEKLSDLLSEIEKDSEGIITLSENSSAFISVCRHQYVSGNAGIHFDLETINRLQKLKLAVDIDTYIVGTEIHDE